MQKIPFQVILFIFFASCLASFINTGNTIAFGLQPRCIESIVENKTIHLDSAVDIMEPYTAHYTWDVFSYKNHVYINKQPGQFLLGAIPYYFLHLFGINYKTNFNLTCGVVTLFTSVLMTAFIMVLLFNIAFSILKNRITSFFVAFFSGFGTLLLPYSGVVQHDMCATFFLFLGFYFLFCRYHISKNNPFLMLSLSGFFTALSFFCSYNVMTIIFAISLYVLCKRKVSDILVFGVFAFLGMSISLIFNFIVFGNPFKFAIVMYSDFFHQSHEFSLMEYLPSILKRIDLYLLSPITAIEFYSPIFIISYFGILLLPKKYFLEKIILLLAFPLQFFQPCLFGVAGYGWCQYGPRYLLECTPFTMIGLIGCFSSIRNLSSGKQFFLKIVILLFGISSVVICAVGSMGVIYCNYSEYAFVNYFQRILSNNDLPIYFFAPFGIVVAWFSVLLLFIKRKKHLAKSIFSKGLDLARAFIFLLIIIIYFWFLSSGKWNLFQPAYLGAIFDSLGNGILKGTYEVDRFALAWEAFIVNGKYYAYWGPFPALLRIICNGLFKGNYGLWSNLSCLVASSLSLFAYYKSLNLVLDLNKELSKSFKNLVIYVTVLFFGLGSPFLFLSSMGQVYHEAILWGFCFGLFGIYYFLSYYFENKPNSLYFLSLVSGLALITRVTFFIPIGILFFLSLINYIQKQKFSLKIKNLISILLILIPLLIPAAFQAEYNFKRFGSYITFADYKYYYLFNNEELKKELYYKHGFYNVKRLIPNIKSYFFFNKHCFNSHYPYICQCPFQIKNLKDMLIYQTLPFTISAPWLLLISILGLVFLFNNKGLILYKLGILGFVGQALSVLLLAESHQRYALDLMIGIVYLSFIFFTNEDIYKKKRWKIVLFLFIVFGIFSTFANVLSTLDETKYFWRN